MSRKMPIKTSLRHQTRQTPAEAIYGENWVKQQWRAVRGILQGKKPKNPIAWQRRTRSEWD